VKELGAQRVIPEPISSVIGEGGILYTFAATEGPASVQFALQLPAPGMRHLAIGVPGSQQARLSIFILP
jgi:hypothetical protein